MRFSTASANRGIQLTGPRNKEEVLDAQWPVRSCSQLASSITEETIRIFGYDAWDRRTLASRCVSVESGPKVM